MERINVVYDAKIDQIAMTQKSSLCEPRRTRKSHVVIAVASSKSALRQPKQLADGSSGPLEFDGYSARPTTCGSPAAAVECGRVLGRRSVLLP